MMAASGRGIEGKGERRLGLGPRGRAREAKETGKLGTRRWRAGGGGGLRCRGWIEKIVGRGSAARRKGRGGVSLAGGKREGASRAGARARGWGKGRRRSARAGALEGGGAEERRQGTRAHRGG